MISSQKFYGDGDVLEINNWEDLKKLETLGKESPEAKDIFYDCIPNL